MRMSVERPVIERAIQLLERGWAMDAYAVDKAGRTVSYWSTHAERFCAAGAILRAVFDVMGRKDMRLSRSIETRINGPLYRRGTSLITLNDGDGDRKGVIRAMRRRLNEL